MGTRKNQAALSPTEWKTLIDAITAIHSLSLPAPHYMDFVAVHVRAMNASDPAGMSWGVHTMSRMMRGRNFLAWHRQYLLQLEKRLQQVDGSITLPYWDAITDRAIPAAMADAQILASWGITRHWNAALLPVQQELTALNTTTGFTTFQSTLEATIHDDVHNAVGGDLATAASPKDPLFWLHHANIDRLWAEWQRQHTKAVPPNKNETLQPPPLFGVKVASVLDIGALGYQYA